MGKQVIVVVHGVGVKQAGVSSDLLAAALQDDDGASAETRLPPHSSDDFVLLERKPYDRSGKASTFPARIRRYRSYENGNVKDERVIADFFWGDVTAFGSSVVSVVLAYFKVAMGLSHAIRENAKEAYPEETRLDRWIQKLARGAALTIHGPIIALNAVLLVGLVIASVLEYLLKGNFTPPNLVRVQILLVALIAIGSGLLLLRQGGAFLYRHLTSWIALSGLLFLLVASPELFGQAKSATVEWIDSWLAWLQCGVGYKECIHSGLVQSGFRLLVLLSSVWVLLLLEVIALWVLGFTRRMKQKGKEQGKAEDKEAEWPRAPNLVAPAIGLMCLLWFLLTAALWAAVLKLPAAFNRGVEEKTVAAPLVAIGAAVLVLGLVVVAAGLVLLRKGELKGSIFKPPSNYMANGGAKAPEYANRYRLLIASRMLGVLCFFLPLAGVTWSLVYFESTSGIQDWLAQLAITLIFAVLAAGSALVYSFNAEFSAGLGILADVLAYLNNSSWTSGSASDPYKIGEPPTRTWVERLLFKKKDDPPTNANPRGYWLRCRIHNRLDVLVSNLIRDEKPDRLDIVSHSQGTMIAIDLIDLRGPDWLKELRNGSQNGRMNLVTMGSPYTHLYGHYFPSSFLPVARRANLAEGVVLEKWLNIFRIDDFVGTHIGTGAWPSETPVGLNGHTNYWVDRNVVEELRNFLK